jgi:hypothetical protein
MTPSKRNKRRGSREADCIPSTARFEAAIQSVLEVTHRQSKQKRTIKRKKGREPYDGDIVDPVMP